MPTIPEMLKEDIRLHDALSKADAFNGRPVPSLERLMQMTAMDETTMKAVIGRFCDKKILEIDENGILQIPKSPIQIHYNAFRSFQQMLEYPRGGITSELISAETMEADAYMCELLKLPAEEKMIQLRRIYYQDQVPFAHERYDVRCSLLKNTTFSEMKKVPLLQIIQKNLPTPVDSLAAPELVQSQYFSLADASERDGMLLGIAEGAPVLYIGGRVYHQNLALCSYIIRTNMDKCALKYQSYAMDGFYPYSLRKKD